MVQASKFDKDRERIEELLALGLSVRKIVRLLGYNNHVGLNTYTYVRKQNVHEAGAVNNVMGNRGS